MADVVPAATAIEAGASKLSTSSAAFRKPNLMAEHDQGTRRRQGHCDP